jgi:DNA-binding CsgD family transcriptional regulator
LQLLLTLLELEIVDRSSHGEGNKEIGAEMNIGIEKLTKMRKGIFKKLKVESMIHAVGNAFQTS